MAPSTDCQARGASSDVETLIRDIWAGGRKEMLWAKYGPYKVYSENLLVLAPGKELEGEIVNAYLSWIGAKAGVYILYSYLMTSLWQGTHKGGLRKIIYLKENGSLFFDPFGANEDQLCWLCNRCKDLTRSLVRKKKPFGWEMGLHDHHSP